MNTIYFMRNTLGKYLPSGLISTARYLESKIAPPPKFVIIGTGRSGTTYIAELLTECGIPCGHETIFDYRGITKRFGYKGDVSWLALPYLSNFNGTVLHQTRHPMKVINSLLGINFFTHNSFEPFRNFASQYFYFSGDEVNDAMRWYTNWNTWCEEYASFRFKVEELDEMYADLLKAININDINIQERFRIALNKKEKSTNTRAKMNLTFSDLPNGRDKDALLEISQKYGYQIEK